MDEPLVETWLIHDRINRYLLDAISDDALAAALPKRRTVSDLFAHVHKSPGQNGAWNLESRVPGTVLP